MTFENIINILIDNYKPYSIFLYGSKATNTDNSKSDYEIGIIFNDEKYVPRMEIAKLISDNNYSVYPFRLNEVLSCDIDTPFQKNIYISVLISGGARTIYGKKVLENLKMPGIKVDDLLADINFNLGIAFSSVRVYKSGNIDLANDMFYKSCLYATRDLIYFTLNKLCLSYKEIYELSQGLEMPEEYRKLIDIAFAFRSEEKAEINSEIYFQNISYINKFVLSKFRPQ